MASKTTPTVAVMSIHPIFAARILRGEKRVEFRKQRPRKELSHILIYATAPTQQIVGYFEVVGIDEAHPREIWSRFRKVGGIASKHFWAYYGKRTRAYAIRVGRVFRLPGPCTLHSVCGTTRPPQSFCYARALSLESVKRGVHQGRIAIAGQ
jgi:predicted transcriptional regulator